VIAAAGDAADAFYLVVSGRVRIEVDADDGTRRVVAERGPGEAFDERALFSADTRADTVIAVERTRLARMARADFEELVEDVPGIALGVCRVLGRDRLR
jgi:NTE family protein